jgi:hypothetical protein
MAELGRMRVEDGWKGVRIEETTQANRVVLPSRHFGVAPPHLFAMNMSLFFRTLTIC